MNGVNSSPETDLFTRFRLRVFNRKDTIMGLAEDAKKKMTEAGEAAADKLKEAADKVHDSAKEMRADARVDQAKAERDELRKDSE